MFNFIRKLLPLALATALLLPAAVHAETVSIIAGTNQSSQTTISFSAVTLDITANQISTASNGITVRDSRGSGAGWSVSVSSTDFVSGSLPDPTTSGTYTVKIPASAVSVIVGTPVISLSGQSVDPTHGPLAYNGTLSATPLKLIQAAPGYGMGEYTAGVSYSLAVPKTVTVASVSSGSSKYEVNDVVGTVATTYTATLTFTLGSGV
ncbi:WxL domain-containing protein [Paenibacillus brevis]|uniref:WxL domain-containing protein n=1 Tax=Paenibacillus brevis TaxID=2841508 RepID=A0ABS6FPM1_9BACL|nr:WxL domain-containing protein [Paenibacillus brevis]MBU5672175.1 WxL domain-containing protein [Paenibacillus brevis]